ncbi:c-type cytochrome [Pseudalkalibacillus caeni]|uniref:C-type cytochrome n=1 Tax=Exobacillus caeni TaxID=2574798 RepID=A0A5R9F8A8_9BACL|nr:c-type cytochrome [Pseudalkalibacillus caeni]TLS35965.1 c-type cytochrome [Pseudalkalibacillus caeni]
MKNAIAILIGFFLLGAFWVGFKISQELMTEQAVSTAAPSSLTESLELVFSPPSLDDVPDGPLGESIKYGHKLVDESSSAMPQYVGNKLSCTSCHAGAGLEKESSPLVGVASVFPQYRPREGVVFTLEDRINGCMVRSMNGEKLPYDSKEMRAMVAYLTYISEGVPVDADVPWRMQNTMKDIPEPEVAAGEELYQKSCIACHAADGAGLDSNSGPALWGENSFNDGAGMSRLAKMAGYLQNNMPKGQEGTLSKQDAANIAAFVLSHDRPEWKGHETDWPKGGRPNDIINKERREQIQNNTIDWNEVIKPAN